MRQSQFTQNLTVELSFSADAFAIADKGNWATALSIAILPNLAQQPTPKV